LDEEGGSSYNEQNSKAYDSVSREVSDVGYEHGKSGGTGHGRRLDNRGMD